MEIISREINSSNWITLVILSCFVLLTIVKLINAAKFSDFIVLFHSNKYLVLYQKGKGFSTWFNGILVLVQIFSVSLFIYFYLANELAFVKSEQLILFAKIFTIYFLIVFCKLLIEKIVGTIFSIELLIEEYIYYKISYRNLFGVFLLPLNMIFAFVLKPTSLVVQVLIGVVLILNMIVLILIYRKKEKLIINNLFYFILYLCALEIAPYYIVYKILI